MSLTLGAELLKTRRTSNKKKETRLQDTASSASSPSRFAEVSFDIKINLKGEILLCVQVIVHMK